MSEARLNKFFQAEAQYFFQNEDFYRLTKREQVRAAKLLMCEKRGESSVILKDDNAVIMSLAYFSGGITWHKGILASDMEKALKYAGIAAESGSADGYFLCSWIKCRSSSDGSVWSRELPKMEKAYERGSNIAAYGLGMVNYYGAFGMKLDRKKALQYWTKLAEKKDAQGLYILGHLYYFGASDERGFIVERNRVRGLEYAQLSVDYGCAGAEWLLGVIYMEDPMQSDEVAMQHFRNAVNMGFYSAFKDMLRLQKRRYDTGRVEKAILYDTYKEALRYEGLMPIGILGEISGYMASEVYDNRSEEALEALKRAIEAGYFDKLRLLNNFTQDDYTGLILMCKNCREVLKKKIDSGLYRRIYFDAFFYCTEIIFSIMGRDKGTALSERERRLFLTDINNEAEELIELYFELSGIKDVYQGEKTIDDISQADFHNMEICDHVELFRDNGQSLLFLNNSAMDMEYYKKSAANKGFLVSEYDLGLYKPNEFFFLLGSPRYMEKRSLRGKFDLVDSEDNMYSYEAEWLSQAAGLYYYLTGSYSIRGMRAAHMILAVMMAYLNLFANVHEWRVDSVFKLLAACIEPLNASARDKTAMDIVLQNDIPDKTPKNNACRALRHLYDSYCNMFDISEKQFSRVHLETIMLKEQLQHPKYKYVKMRRKLDIENALSFMPYTVKKAVFINYDARDRKQKFILSRFMEHVNYHYAVLRKQGRYYPLSVYVSEEDRWAKLDKEEKN